MNTQTNTVNSVNAKRSSSAKKNISITAEQLRDMYLVEGISLPKIAEKYGVTSSAINYWMRKFGLAGQRHIDNLLFEPSPALSYVLGVVLGDGCVYLREKGNYVIKLHVCDRVFAERFSDAVTLLGFTPGKLIHQKSTNINWRDAWTVCFYSNAFGNWYTEMTLDDRLNTAMAYPDAFTRGFYESEGTLVRHRGNLDLTICHKQAKGKVIDAILKHLPKGITAYRRVYNYGDGDVYSMSITRNLDVRRFLAWTMPCIKTVPRSEEMDYVVEEVTQANTEPILDRNVEAGVENTKAAQNGTQVGRRVVTDDVQPSGRSQPVRCIPICRETCRAQQKWSAPGKAASYL